MEFKLPRDVYLHRSCLMAVHLTFTKSHSFLTTTKFIPLLHAFHNCFSWPPGGATRASLRVAAVRGDAGARAPGRLGAQHPVRGAPRLALARGHARTQEVQLGSHRTLLIQPEQEEPHCGTYSY